MRHHMLLASLLLVLAMPVMPWARQGPRTSILRFMLGVESSENRRKIGENCRKIGEHHLF